MAEVRHRSMFGTVRNWMNPVAQADPEPEDSQQGKLSWPDPGAEDTFYNRDNAPTPGYGNSWESISAAYACVGYIASALAGMPKVVAREATFGSRSIVQQDHMLNSVMKFPSRVMDDIQVWETVCARMLATGNGYMLIERISGGRMRLHPLWDAQRTNPNPRNPNDEASWSATSAVDSSVAYNSIPDSDIIHLHNIGLKDFKAPSPIQKMAKTILMSKQAQSFLSGRLSDKFRMTSVTYDRKELGTSLGANIGNLQELIDKFKEGYKKAQREGSQTMFWPAGMKIDDRPLFNATDMQAIEVLKFSVEEICRIYGVSPRMVGHFASGQRVENKVGTQAEDFWRNAVKPWAQRIEAQLTLKLIKIEERMDGLRVKLLSEGVREGSPEERMRNASHGYADGGLITQNEGRAIIGLPPTEDGDKFQVPRGGTDQGGRPQSTDGDGQ